MKELIQVKNDILKKSLLSGLKKIYIFVALFLT
jgi:hypothetical protein